MNTYLSIDDLIDGSEAAVVRKAFEQWRDAISSAPEGQVVSVGNSQIVGMRLAMPGHDTRFLSAWISGAVSSLRVDTAIAISGERGDFRRLQQFTDVQPTNVLFFVADGPNSARMLESVRSAVKSFDPSIFDSDGYMK